MVASQLRVGEDARCSVDESLADSGTADPGWHRERAKSGPAGREVAPALVANVGVERDRPHDPFVVLRHEHLGRLEPRSHVDERSARYASRIQSEPDPRYGSSAGANTAAISCNSRARAGLIETGASACQGSGRGDVRTRHPRDHACRSRPSCRTRLTHTSTAHIAAIPVTRPSVAAPHAKPSSDGERRGMVAATGAGTVDRAVIGTVERAAMAVRIAGSRALSCDRIRVVASPGGSECGRHERERDRDENCRDRRAAGERPNQVTHVALLLHSR